jgi:hypothetical protein
MEGTATTWYARSSRDVDAIDRRSPSGDVEGIRPVGLRQMRGFVPGTHGSPVTVCSIMRIQT